ncbi:MAG: hypothetical protein V3G42_13210 [Oscillospiraceae bacterium]
MEIQAFQEGTKAWMLDCQYGNESSSREMYVLTVGKKYVHVIGCPESVTEILFERTDYGTQNAENFLKEHTSIGKRRLLFLTKQALEEYLEFQELEKWLFTVHHKLLMHPYSLQQLRTIKKILEDNCL